MQADLFFAQVKTLLHLYFHSVFFVLIFRSESLCVVDTCPLDIGQVRLLVSLLLEESDSLVLLVPEIDMPIELTTHVYKEDEE